MGILDFDTAFKMLDPGCRGYISANDVEQYDKSMNGSLTCDKHVVEAIKVCGSDAGHIVKDKFVKILQELKRRRHADEQAMWDFTALDKTGSNRLSLLDGLLLFQTRHNEKFSLDTWNKFLTQREGEGDEVYFDEMRMFLCEKPSGPVATTEDIEAEKTKLQKSHRARIEEQYEAYLNSQAMNSFGVRERQDYEEKTRRLARRKLNKWEKDGLESLLSDDGIDHGERIPLHTKSHLGINDLLDTLDLKYNMLREKLFYEMLSHHHGDVIWSSMSDGEQAEAFELLLLEEKQLRRDQTLKTKCANLQGAQLSHVRTLKGLMGFVGELAVKDSDESEKRRKALLEKERGHTEMYKKMKRELLESFKGPMFSSDILIKLHERQQQEKENLLDQMRNFHNHPGSADKGMLNLYCQLMRQQLALEGETNFLMASQMVGLAERSQKYGVESLNRIRQELLAESRLELPSLRPSYTEPVTSEYPGLVDLQIVIIHHILFKHALEREVFYDLLNNKDALAARSTAQDLTPDQRTSRLTILRNQHRRWRDRTTEYQKAHKQIQMGLMQEGLLLYWLNRWHWLGSTTEQEVNGSVLADIQQKQDQEAEKILMQMRNQSISDLVELKHYEESAQRLQLLDNMAAVVLGAFECTQDETPFISALEDKYSILRKLLLLHTLRIEHGVVWDRLSTSEQQRLLQKKTLEEEKKREEGRLEETSSLLSTLPKDFGGLRQLLGEDKAAFFLSQETGKVQESDGGSTELLLADLLQRFYVEQDHIIRQVRSGSSDKQQWWLPLVLVRLEKRCLTQEDWFDTGALALGLLERVTTSLTNRSTFDIERQKKVAQLRVTARRRRLDAGVIYAKQKDEQNIPDTGDIAGWMERLLWEIEKRHIEEREQLLMLLQDPSMEDLHEAALAMSSDDRQHRLEELFDKRQHIDLQLRDGMEENLCIMEEAAAIQYVQQQQHQQNLHENGDEDDTSGIAVMADLLSQLQDLQDMELATTILRIHRMTEEELRVRRVEEMDNRHQMTCHNVLSVLTQGRSTAIESSTILKEVDKKYDALRDQLLLEALMRQYGETEWNRLSQKERQRLLLELRLKERRLRQQGQWDELAALLGQGDENEKLLKHLMGEHRAEYERKLRERLEERRLRKETGLDGGDDDSEADDLSEQNVLEELDKRCQDEKDALLRQLIGEGETILTDDERHAELIRLKWEAEHIAGAGDFQQAALAVGLSERHHAEGDIASEMQASDADRQEELARQRLIELAGSKKLYGKKHPGTFKVVKSDDNQVLQEAVLKQLEEQHSSERQLLSEILSLPVTKDKKMLAEGSTQLGREEMCEQLRRSRENMSLDKISDQHRILYEASIYKRASRQRTLALRSNMELEAVEEDVDVSLMSELQDKQASHAENIIQEMTQKDSKCLLELQQQLIRETQQQHALNVAKTLLYQEDPSDFSDNNILETLDNKYDALREKLLLEALIKQTGEAEWAKLSAEERQKRLLMLRLEERRLRREGKWDDLAALLGENIKTNELLEGFARINRDEHQRKLQERLNKRRQRLANGLTEEECDELEDIDQEDDANECNPLQDLNNCYEKEREKLLQNLKRYDDDADAEKNRQLELTRLRWEQRALNNEERFGTAALVLSLGWEQGQKLEAVQKEQEELARQRLQARRQNRNKRSATPLVQLDIPMPDDDTDLSGMREAVLREIEQGQTEERDMLLTLLEAAETQQYCQAFSGMEEKQKTGKREELKIKYKYWRASASPDQLQQTTMLQEACGLSLAEHAQVLSAQGKSAEPDSLIIALLADLQKEQDFKNQNMRLLLQDKGADELRQLKQTANEERQKKWYDTMTALVLGLHVTSQPADDITKEDKGLVNQLEDMYESMKSKLLMQAMRKKLGELEWSKLSEKEKQHRLIALLAEEKRLRIEGRDEEAAALLGDDEDQKEILAVLDIGLDQTDREKAKKNLAAERAKQGLSTDDAVLEGLLDQQITSPDSKKDVLKLLNMNFEAERDALLRGLNSHDSAVANSKKRQILAVELKRRQKQLKQEESTHGAALLLQQASLTDKQLQDGMSSERERQLALAQQRIIARKLPSKSTALSDGETELQSSARTHLNGLGKAQLAAVTAVDERHVRERQLLLDLLKAATKDKTLAKELATLEAQDVRYELQKLGLDHNKWQRVAHQVAVRYTDKTDKTEEDKQAHNKQIAGNRMEQWNRMKKATALQIMMDKYEENESSDDDTKHDLSVRLLASLQEAQTAENSALYRVFTEREEDVVQRVSASHEMALAEGWLYNLATTLFSMREEDGMDTVRTENEDVGQAPPMLDDVDKKISGEFEKEKAQLLDELEKKEKDGVEVDIQAELARLQSEQESKRQSIEAALNKQREAFNNKLTMRHEKQNHREREDQALLEMMKIAERQKSFLVEQQDNEKTRQSQMMREKLAARSAARRETTDRVSSSTMSSRAGTGRSRPDIFDQDMPGFGLKREKTVLDVDMSDDHKKEVYQKLVREHTAINRHMDQEHRKHEQQLKQRLEVMKNRRSGEAKAVFSKAERQKGQLERTQQEGRDRHAMLTKERLERLRNEADGRKKSLPNLNIPRSMTSRRKSHGDSLK